MLGGQFRGEQRKDMIAVELSAMTAEGRQFAVEEGLDVDADGDLGSGNAELLGRNSPEVRPAAGSGECGQQFGIEPLRDGGVVEPGDGMRRQGGGRMVWKG